MKSFLLFLCLAAAEKLDRTYLPPPGSKFSGGAPGDIQVPFEIPKEAYTTSARPDIYNNGAVSSDDTRIEIGINRGVPIRPGIPGDFVTSGDQRPVDYNQNSFKVPTTTTSYAFTTTTTHPPGEEFEATTGPLNPATGLPTSTFDHPTSSPSFFNPEANNQGNQQIQFQQTQQLGRVPPFGSSQYPSQFMSQNLPGFVQDHNNENLSEDQVNPYPVNSIRQENVTPNNTLQYGGDLDQGIVSHQNVPFSQENNPLLPSSNIQGSYYPAQTQLEYNLTPGQRLPQGAFQQGQNKQPGQIETVPNQEGLIPQQYPISQTDRFGRPVQNNNVYRPYPSTSPTNLGSNLNQYSTTTPGSQSFVTQQYPISETDQFGKPVVHDNNVYRPFSTASPTMPVSNVNQYPSTTPGFQPSITTSYPTGSPTTTPIYSGFGNQAIQTDLISRPERPQAESDRNAVILNYDNIITPDGFAYSFNTSNGIHADESGTAVDGVKAKGSYSYIGDDGKLYTVIYTADENGFQPHGDHLPTAPPIPEAIKKVIEQAKKDQEEGVSDDGTYNEDKYGHMKYQDNRLQRPNEINFNSKVPDEGLNDQHERRYQYQNINKGPISYNQNNYEDIEDEPSHIISESLSKGQPTDKTSYRKPVNRIPEHYNEEYNSTFNSGYGNEKDDTGGKTVSRRPTVRPNGESKQHGDKSAQRPYPYSDSDEYILRPEQGSNFDDHAGKVTINKNFSNDGYRRNPVDNKPSLRPGEILSNIPNSKDSRDEYENKKYTTIIPISFHDGERTGDERRVINSEIPSGRPGHFSSNTEFPSVPDSYQEKYGYKIHPVTSTAQPFVQTDIHNYQDSKIAGGLNKYLPGRGYTNQASQSPTSTSTPVSGKFIGIPLEDNNQQIIENRPGQRYRPTSGRPQSISSGATYDVMDTNTYDITDARVPVSGNTEVPSSSYQYRPSKFRPQSSTRPSPQLNNEYYISTEPSISNQVQNVRRPGPVHRPSGYTTVVPVNGNEGYQYLPPQRKFEQGSQFTGSSRLVPSSRVPSQNRTYFNKGEVAKPFTTPDASRSEEVIEDDYEHTQNNNQFKEPQYNQILPSQRPTTTQQVYDTYNKENAPENYNVPSHQGPVLSQDGTYGNRKDFIRIPQKTDGLSTTGSTRQPPYQQIQTTARPQQTFVQPTVSFHDATKEGPTKVVRPQEGDRYVEKDEDESTYVTSTPASTSYFETTRPTTFKPIKQSANRFIGVNGQSPTTQGFFPTTTRASPQTSGRFDARPTQHIYEQTPSQSPYQTTYRPMLSVSSGVNSEETLPTTIRPDKVSFRRPGYSQKQIPSTTYRPAYFPDKTVTEQSVYNFGRPLPDSQHGFRPEFSVTPGKISSFDKGFTRPQGGFKPGRPSSTFDHGNLTYRPESTTTEKIIGEDFSGPKQAQKFDAERGYYY